MASRQPATATFEERLAATYRQSACWLASTATKETKATAHSTSGNETNKDDIARISLFPSHQLSQQLMHCHPGFISASLDGAMKLNKHQYLFEDIPATVTAELYPSDEIYVPCCKYCGSVIQVGHEDTTLRVMAGRRLTRAQKVRASRKQRKTLKLRQNQPQFSRVWEYGEQSDFSVPLAEQSLKLTCGSCGNDTFVATHGKDKQHTSYNKEGNAQDMKKFPKELEKKKDSKKRKETDLDFIPLPTIAKKSNSVLPPRQTLDQPRKKKKKKSDNPLMNFLSSLND